MQPIFDDKEVMDLMRELVGDRAQLLWCDTAISGETDFDRGIPPHLSATCRPIWGYVLSDQETEVAVGGDDFSAKGDFKAVILASDVPKNSIRPDSRLVFNGTVYQVEFSQTYFDRGMPKLHELKLMSGAAGGTHNQPDSILEYLGQ